MLRLITVPLSDGQFDALVSFTFNLGSGALQRSTLRRKVNSEDRRSPGGIPALGMGWRQEAEGLIHRREAKPRFTTLNIIEVCRSKLFW